MPLTYQLINSTSLSSSAASVTFSAIPATYDDLVIKISARNTGSNAGSPAKIRFNGASTDTNLSTTRLVGTGSSALSFRLTYAYLGQFDDASATSNTFSFCEIYIPKYAASQAKPFSTDEVYENNSSSLWYIEAMANLFNSTTAISSLEIIGYDNFVSGSTFWLYGISNS